MKRIRSSFNIRLSAAIATASLLATAVPAASTLPVYADAEAQSTCQYMLGFAELHSLIPNQIGNCVGNESHLPNGNGKQTTENGLLTWDKDSNQTLFTNGEDIYVLKGQQVQPMVADPALTLRTTLANLLSEHADLAVIAMQKGVDGAPDFQAVADQLDQNSVALSKAIASVYGEDAGTAFLKQWRDHIGMFVAYTQATAKHDEAGRQQALNDLAGYKTTFANFLHGANPNLPADVLSQGLQEHINQLTGALDAYVAKDYAKAYDLAFKAHDHMIMTGTALAGGIVQQMPEKFSGNPATKAADLQVALDQLLSQHATYSILAMQKGLDGAPDFQALADRLDQNSVALSKAIASVYGESAGTTFLKQWRDHIGMFVAYVQATAKQDEAGRQQALNDLAGYKVTAADFLNSANPNLPADVVAQSLQQHVDQLIAGFNAYADKDYAKAYQALDQSQNHMFMTGEALANGIVKQFPEKFI